MHTGRQRHAPSAHDPAPRRPALSRAADVFGGGAVWWVVGAGMVIWGLVMLVLLFMVWGGE